MSNTDTSYGSVEPVSLTLYKATIHIMIYKLSTQHISYIRFVKKHQPIRFHTPDTITVTTPMIITIPFTIFLVLLS